MTEHARAVQRLAGFSQSMNRVRRGLTESETAELCNQVALARLRAGLSLNRFLALNHAALNEFCARYGFNRAEIRFAQRFIAMMWAMRRASRVAEVLADARRAHVRGVQ
jgi:hypothetical protein